MTNEDEPVSRWPKPAVSMRDRSLLYDTEARRALLRFGFAGADCTTPLAMREMVQQCREDDPRDCTSTSKTAMGHPRRTASHPHRLR